MSYNLCDYTETGNILSPVAELLKNVVNYLMYVNIIPIRPFQLPVF